MSGGSRDPGTSVTSKALRVLSAFESTKSPMTLTVIAERSGLAASTAHRLVGELVEWGALERTSSSRYQIGIRLWELAQSAGRQLRESARPWVQDLAALTNQSVMISVRQGRDSLVIERAHGDHRAAQTSAVGSRLPLHTSAAGKVLLAFDAEWVRRSYLSEPLDRLTPSTHVNPEGLTVELGKTLEDGWATSLQEVRHGASAIAVPIFHSGQVAAAVGIVAEAARASQLRTLLPALRATAAGIEGATRHLPREALFGVAHDETEANS